GGGGGWAGGNVSVIWLRPCGGGRPSEGSVTAPGLRALVYLFAPGRREDAHLLPVLRHGPPRDVDLLLREQLGDVLIAQRLASVLLGDDGSDGLLHALCRHLLTVTAAQARGEAGLQLGRAMGARRGVP